MARYSKRPSIGSPKPPAAEGGQAHSLLWYLVRQLKWLLFGVPKPHTRGKWVYNAKDDTWRYYVLDEEYY